MLCVSSWLITGNAALDAVSARFGTLHFDAAGTRETYDRRMWAVDRLHPNERGTG
jgi:hypothetical protein